MFTEAIAQLQELGAYNVPHANGKSLGEHLTDTAELLAVWGQPEWMCLAGLFHSVYGTDAFRERLVPLDEREKVATIIGPRAEHLAYLYGVLPRGGLEQALAKPMGGASITFPSWLDDVDPQVIEWQDMNDLYVLHTANVVVQAPYRHQAQHREYLPQVRSQSYLGGFRLNQDDPRMGFYPGLRAEPFWSEPVPLAQALEEQFEGIGLEIEALPPGMFMRESEKIQRDGDWKVAFLYERGKRNQEVCKALPLTTAIIDHHRSIRTHGGLIYVSKLGPKSHVKPHRGPTNMRLRLHLPISGDPLRSGMKVGGYDVRQVEYGRAFVFSDYYVHEAWNSAAEERVHLIVDLWHPDLTDWEVGLLAGMQRYGQATGEDLQAYLAINETARQPRRPKR